MGSDYRLVGGVLPYLLVVGKTDDSLTSSAGALALVEAWRAAGLDEACTAIGAKKRARGLSDAQWILGGILTVATGGKTVEDVEHLKKDQGLSRALPWTEDLSARYLLDFLCRFHDDEAIRQALRKVPCDACKKALEPILAQDPLPLEKVREVFERSDHGGHAFIPEETAPLRALDERVNRQLISAVQKAHPCDVATLDGDASIHGSRKKQAFCTYEGERGYQPVIVTWAEQQLIVADQFRDGHVPAAMGNIEVVQRAIANLPKGVQMIRYRGDSASYDHVLMRYLDDAGHPLAISARVSKQLRDAIRALPEDHWRPAMKRDGSSSDREVAELPYVPAEARERRGMRPFRYVAIRVPRRQYGLFDDDADAAALEAEGACAQDTRYRYFAVVTNISEGEMDSSSLINWHREKCGTVEYEHDILKNDLAAATFPSKLFGADAAWYRLNSITRNLFTLVSLGLPKKYRRARPHTLRQALVRVAGRVVSTGRRLVLWLGVAGLDVVLEQLRAFLARLHGT
jgi:hypothetical protein